jgi:hypothetical protein
MPRGSKSSAESNGSEIDLVRLKMDLEAFRKQTIRFIDQTLQQIDAMLPAAPTTPPFDWREDIKNW